VRMVARRRVNAGSFMAAPVRNFLSAQAMHQGHEN
jgi:hypothetical protein